jgi:hypothetical protein
MNFMGLGGISDEALLKSGAEALAIGFPLDGPVRDATLMALKLTRNVRTAKPEYLQFLSAVQARYPEKYAELSDLLIHHLTYRSMEVSALPALLLAKKQAT